ncbi:MAG: hypothetical protein F4081_02335 [Dehalococcoidia bacterium]|nr:hypothetical protein [Gemmatimonadota bacterium]MYI85637.1 hypothetical protein [Dehalococcoidia bacterium]
MDGSETPEREREQALLEHLRDLIDEAGQGGAARQLGVDRKTLWRALDSGRLTPTVTKALERRGANPEAARRRSRLDALERRTEALDKDVEGLDETVEALREEFRTLADLQAEALRAWERRLSAVESRRAAGSGREPEPPATDPGAGPPPASQAPGQPVVGRAPVAMPHRPHPEFVTLRAEEGEELVYGEAAPVIAEWRRQRIAQLDEGASGVEQARARVRMHELGLVLAGEYELTLPLDTFPVDTLRLRDERERCERALRRARRELVRAHCWRFLRRVLTLGVWRH